MSTITDIHRVGAKAAHGPLVASSFHRNQNDKAQSFANRFFVATAQVPDAVHPGAYVAVRHYLWALVASEGQDAD